MSGFKPLTRLPKRFRASDADNIIPIEAERVKRRRTSRRKNETTGSPETIRPNMRKETINHPPTVHKATDYLPHCIDQDKNGVPGMWSLSTPVGGQYTNLDPILTRDEEYLFIGLEAAVHVYSVATSRLFRTLQLKPSQSVIGYSLSSANEEHLYVVTSAGSVSKWDWLSGKQISRWTIGRKMISVSRCFHPLEGGMDISLLTLRECKSGKREMVLTHFGERMLHETVILETNARLEHIKCTSDGQAIIVYGSQRVFFGTQCLRQGDLESMQYTWKEMVLPVSISCLDIRDSATSFQGEEQSSNRNGSTSIDLAFGGSDGSILIYHNILGLLGKEEHDENGKTGTPRRLHWHRDLVNAIRWSRDGNYIISGGNESVMVLWQLDTGRKQFLPHLSSPICNIVVSPTGNSYVIKLADNSIAVLSARELQPCATITGLQSYSQMNNSRTGVYSPCTPSFAAILHPQYPDRLLVIVPASRQIAHESHHHTSFCVLQTYDICSNNHIFRQALARTNATTLKVNPEGLQIVAPNVTHLGVSQDGKWMSTVDKWRSCPHDAEVLDSNGVCIDSIAADQEIFLKFWRWNNSSDFWELVARIDGPHFSDKDSASILDLASRPLSHEFATIGSDTVLRFWCPSKRHRNGLKMNDEVPLETWKCRSIVDLKDYTHNDNSGNLSTASITFSQDGTVLAVCLQSVHSRNTGLTILVDAQSCTVHYSRVGVYPGDPCVARFLGCHLVIASTQSISIWDTVDDIVRTPGPSEGVDCSFSDKAPRLLAVDSNTQTFAVTLQCSKSPPATKKGRKCFVQVYDIHSLSLLCQLPLGGFPNALLADSQSSDYIVVDAAANVRRLGCSSKTSQAAPARDLAARVNSGIAGLLGNRVYGTEYHHHTRALVSMGIMETFSQGKELAEIFGDSPFVLPSASTLFRDVVQALAG
ncbi:WD40-repeat-containing domain protein [Aspergillus coremiiformis]|uniref:WD40-repeat-containing domain protein n=1 Tax=Aspergillus coremiiformis TaxID=138285 RepID=A0A5N6YS31_9EURO|nr:WD40-repeat-containing domain protein [Aspergillus coremiiformis]